MKVIAIRHFFFEPQARLYAARLETEGIPCFISNSNSITAFPLGEAGIGLHIRETDKERALVIIDELEKYNVEEDFREADHADIAFQKEVDQTRTNPNKWVLVLLILLILLLLIRTLLQALGLIPAWDFF